MSANHPVSSASATASLKPHKRVRWHKPTGKRRPGVIDATRAALVRCLEMRQGAAWSRIRDRIAITGYTIEQAQNGRIRSLRSDGAESLLAMAVTLLHASDVRTGFVGKPRIGGGRWERYSLRDLAQLAYGSQGAADIRRASRAIAGMVSLGWIWPSKQVRRPAGDQSFRSEAAVRRVNLSRICDMVGTRWLLERDRRVADQKHGTNTANLAEAREAKAQREKRVQERRDSLNRLETELRSTAGHSPAYGPPRATGTGSGPALLQDILSIFK